MLEREDFKSHSEAIIQWINNYFKNIESLPVKSKVKPGDIYKLFPKEPPITGISTDEILRQVNDKILPGMTHWQHPHFHAYFPGNASTESLLAEMVTSAMAAQCMIWETSPSAAELEQLVTEWLASMLSLPKGMEGVIQDTASTATLASILTARERITNFQSNKTGVPGNLRIYTSAEAHSSIEKAVAISGIGTSNMVKIAVDKNMALDPIYLESQIIQDIKDGYRPCCIIATIGTTGTMGIDPILPIGKFASKYGIWLHIDGAYAGTAVILPEYHWMIEGMQYADSFVFNPHKWMFTQFDCSVLFVRNADELIRCFEVNPEYLNTSTRGLVNDYRDWGIPLGRRFRALKLWWVICSYGVEGIRQKLRSHIRFNTIFAEKIDNMREWDHVTPPFLNFSCIRWSPAECKNEEDVDHWNKILLDHINQSGKAYLSHTKVNGRFAIRVVLGQTYIQEKHVHQLLHIIIQAMDRVRANKQTI